MPSPDGLGPLGGLEICPTCRKLRGRTRLPGKPRDRVQECACERRRRPRGEVHPDWRGFDVPMAVELCRCCGRVPLRSGSRWSVWLCEDCKPRALALNHRSGGTVVPIGRHSMMHGIGLSGSVKDDDADAIEGFCFAANGLFRAIRHLDEWARLRVAFNVERLGFEEDVPVRLVEYLARVGNSNDPDVSADAAFQALLQRMRVVRRRETA